MRRRFCWGVDIIKPLDEHILCDELGVASTEISMVMVITQNDNDAQSCRCWDGNDNFWHYWIVFAACRTSLAPLTPQSGINRLSQVFDVHWRSPEPGGLWYRSGQMKKAICSTDQGK
jgi:hypothetical protein